MRVIALVPLLALAGCVVDGSSATGANPEALPPRVHAEGDRLHSVYWIDIRTCLVEAQPQSVSVTSNHPNFTFRLEPGLVIAERQGCPAPVQGARVVLNQPYDSRVHGTVHFQVRYSGGQQSIHTLGPRF